MLRAALTICLCTLLGGSSAAQSSWTVAQDGSGQFTEVQAAVDAASPGDTILVAPGQYGPVFLDKPLALLGAQPWDTSGALATHLRFLAAVDVPWVRLRGLRIDQVWLQDLVGRSLIEDCHVGHLGDHDPYVPEGPALSVLGGGDLLVQECVLRGYPGRDGALIAGGTLAHLVHVLAYGGAADGSGPTPQAGGHALVLSGSTQLRATLCFLQGGAGQAGHPLPAEGGAALQMLGSAEAKLVGFKNLLLGGNQQAGPSLPSKALRCPPGGIGTATATYVSAQLVVGGIDPCFVPAGELLPFAVPQPLPGARRVRLFGESGAPGAVLLSLHSLAASGPHLPGDLWIDPSWLLDVALTVCQGYDTPAAVQWNVPPLPQLAGLTVHGQGLVLTSAGARTTNAFAFALGP